MLNKKSLQDQGRGDMTMRSARILGMFLALLSAGCSAPPPSSVPPAKKDAATANGLPPAESPADPAPLLVPPRDPEPLGNDRPDQQAVATAPASPPELFQAWPKPKLVFFLTGQQMGYIEPCGCTGLANQKGGLARRATLIKELREKRGWKVVPVDVGSQIKLYGKQSEIKFQKSADGLRKMGYEAVAFGADDLKLTPGDLLSATNPPDQESIFTSVNVALLDRSFTPQFRIVVAGATKIGIIAVLGDEAERKLKGDDLLHSPALEALKKAAAEMQAQKCDLYVLLAHASMDETQKLAQAVPIFDLVVTAGGVGEPTHELEKIKDTKALMAQVGTKGMYAGVVGVFDDGQRPLRYQRIPLTSQYEDDPEMIKLLAEYQKQLEQMGLAELGATEIVHASGHKFVGTAKCGECHTKALAIWERTPHAHATDSLQRPPQEGVSPRTQIPRHHDPECISCHVTGWDPQKFYPYKSGYLGLEKTPHLAHNGCENCHGPGSAHVAAESGDAKLGQDEIQKLRDQLKLPLAGGLAEARCAKCHDGDNDPDFNDKTFDKYWKQVEHKGKD
jgi:Cytochrome c554 and c-prime